MDKVWYRSKGIWGGLITFLSLILALFFGVQVSEDEKTVFIDSLVAIGTALSLLFGGILAIVGRVKASGGIRFPWSRSVQRS